VAKLHRCLAIKDLAPYVSFADGYCSGYAAFGFGTLKFQDRSLEEGWRTDERKRAETLVKDNRISARRKPPAF
jgi:hypothetical protein